MDIAQPTFELKQFCVLSPLSNHPEDGNGTARLYGYTPGVKESHIAECQRLVYLTAPDPGQPEMPAAIGIFPGETVDYILAKSQVNEQGELERQFIFLSRQVFDQLSGNLPEQLLVFADSPLEPLGNRVTKLPPIGLPRMDPLTAEEVEDYLDTVIYYCGENFHTLSTLLTAITEATTVHIINAPPSLVERMVFMQGLLSLLPLPVRHKVTFASNTDNLQATTATLKFISDPPPAIIDGLVFDWLDGSVTTDIAPNSYTRFIISQLKLDTSFVPEQVSQMSSSSLWHGSVGDTLYNLGKVTRRAQLDTALQQGMPIDRHLVAEVLQSDPSLPPEMKALYCQYLLTLVLALNDLDEADKLVNVVYGDPALEKLMDQSLEGAAKGPQAGAVVKLIAYWLETFPAAAGKVTWIECMGKAAVTYCQRVAEYAPLELHAFLESLLNLPVYPELQLFVVEIIYRCRSWMAENLAIANDLFALADAYLNEEDQQQLVTYMLDQSFSRLLRHGTIEEFDKILGNRSVVNQFPADLKLVLVELNTGNPGETPASPDLVVKASHVYGESIQAVLLARVWQYALYHHRPDLIDQGALKTFLETDHAQNDEEFDVAFEAALNTLHAFLKKRQARQAQRGANARATNTQPPNTQLPDSQLPVQRPRSRGLPRWVMLTLIGILIVELVAAAVIAVMVIAGR